MLIKNNLYPWKFENDFIKRDKEKSKESLTLKDIGSYILYDIFTNLILIEGEFVYVVLSYHLL
jgi:hypothetical protein